MILAILYLYVAPMPPVKFGSICIMVWEKMSFEEFQDGHHGHQNGMNLAVLIISMSPKCLPPSYSLIWLTVREQMCFKSFKTATMAAILDIGTERI